MSKSPSQPSVHNDSLGFNQRLNTYIPKKPAGSLSEIMNTLKCLIET